MNAECQQSGLRASTKLGWSESNFPVISMGEGIMIHSSREFLAADNATVSTKTGKFTAGPQKQYHPHMKANNKVH